MPAGEIERFVIEQIKSMGRDPTVLAEIGWQARGQGERSLAELQKEEQALKRELGRHAAELQKLAEAGPETSEATEMAAVQERMCIAEQRCTEIREQIVALNREMVDEREVAAAMSVFSSVWETLNPREQARIIHLLVERVDYDGKDGTVSVTFRANGIKTLAQQPKEIAA